MKTALLLVLFACAAAASSAENLRDDLISAIKKLGEQRNYTYTSTSSGTRSRLTRMTYGTTVCQVETTGLAVFTIMRTNFTNVVVIQGSQGVIKTEDGWKTLADAEDRVRNPGDARRTTRTVARGFLNERGEVIPVPFTTGIEKRARVIKDLKMVDDVMVGELPPEELGGRTFGPGTFSMSPIKSRGTVKYWIKEGVLVKTETKTAQDYGEDDYVESTTVTEFSHVGTTRITVPEEALKLLAP